MIDQFVGFQIQMNKLQHQLEYTLLKPDCYSCWISKMQSDNLEERYAIKLCFKLGKNATETYGILQTAFRPFLMNRALVLEWHERFKQGRESMRDDERREKSKEVNTPELIGQRVRVRVTMLRFQGSAGRDSYGRGKHSSNRVSGISSRTMHQSTTPSLSHTIWTRWASRQLLTLPIVQPLLSVTFGYSLSSEAVVMRQLRRWKRLVTKAVDTLTQEEFHGTLQKLVERYNKCIAAGGDYFEGDPEFHVCTFNKSADTKKVRKLIVCTSYIYIWFVNIFCW